jgi:serine/threonine protein kinase
MESGPVLASTLATVAQAPRQSFERFGRYYLLERIGKGGMAEVYRAVTQGVEGFRRMFVVKRILPDKSTSPEFIQMFGDEARISAVLHHPNIVQVYDFGQVNGAYFLAMEYLLGKDLSSVMRVLRASKAAMPPSLAAFIAQQVAVGLSYAHTLRRSTGESMGIVHRDVTPSNIMLLHAGGVKVLDFGIAKATSAVRRSPDESGGTKVKGKCGYLSPEQARSGQVDARADIFALGVTLWEMLTGKRLFTGANEFETLRNVLQRPVPPPSVVRPGVPAELDRVVLRALERDLDKRYRSAEQMANDLEQILRDARYESQSLRRLLGELFGEESSSLSLEVPDLPEELADPSGGRAPRATAPPGDSIEIVVEEANAAPAVPRTRSIAPPFGVATTASSPMLPELLPRARLPRWMLAACGAALLVGGLGVGYAAFHAGALRGAALVAAVPAAASPAPAPAAPPAAEVPALPVTITLAVDSSPQGATVVASDGAPLGVTPLSVAVPRQTSPRTFTIARAGYQSATYTVTPARDATAFIELERVVPPARPRHRGPSARAAAPGDLGDGLTIDPF